MPGLVYQAQSLTQLITTRAYQHPHTAAIYTSISPSPSSDDKIIQEITYAQFIRHVDRLAWHYAQTLAISPEDVVEDLSQTRVVAVLVPSSIYESLLECALAKLGCCALLLSVNNSAAAVAHLCKLTKATTLIWGGRFAERAKEAAEILAKEGIALQLDEETRPALWGEDAATEKVVDFKAFLAPEQERDRPAVILHSSGSTGFPKPVYVTHYGLIANVALNQNKPAFSTLPVFHGYGHFAVFRSIYAMKPLTLFPPYLPLTAANIIKVLDEASAIPGAKPRQCFAVPYVIKLMAENDKSREALASFDVVSFAGAALPDDLGDRLTEDGVNLLSIYGTTETGSLMNSTRDFDNDKGWNWIRPLPSSKEYLIFEERGGDTFEVVVKDGYPPKIETNREDGSYATKDLFQRHPKEKDWYKYVGRLDDTLVQTLGEKTNPVPMELCIRGNSPYVSEAIVFGAGRPFIGVLILPSALAYSEGLLSVGGSPDELVTNELVGRYVDEIWTVIEQANRDAPSHSRISREMLGVLSHGTEVPVATKMSILRPACYKKFKDHIDAIYEAATSTSSSSNGGVKVNIPAPPEKPTALEDHILDLILSTTSAPSTRQLGKEDDLFEFGVDSLQGARVRNELQKLLAETQVELGQNVVYEHPSVCKLARHLVGLVHGSESKGDEEDELMPELVEKFVGKLVPISEKRAKDVDGQVVLLTGATGSLGAHILSYLLSSPNVDKVICLSRAKSHDDSRSRVKASVQTRKLDITSVQWNKVVSYAADTNSEGGKCGLSEEEWQGLQDVSIVIHNAWPVNFNVSLSSYTPHISGATHLLNLARSTGATFFFSSSISSRQASSVSKVIPEEFSEDTSEAVKTGYGRSKWVTEKILQKAGGRVGVFRIGQMAGDTKDGVWNETEAWPMMMKSAGVLGALPLTHEDVSFLPVDFAGRSIGQIALGSVERPTVYHIIHPGLTSWDDVIIPGLRDAGLKFEPVTIEEWLARLRKSDDDARRNPAKKLLGFYEKRFASSSKMTSVRFETVRACDISSELASTPAVSKELVGKWVDHWKRVGFM